MGEQRGTSSTFPYPVSRNQSPFAIEIEKSRDDCNECAFSRRRGALRFHRGGFVAAVARKREGERERESETSRDKAPEGEREGERKARRGARNTVRSTLAREEQARTATEFGQSVGVVASYRIARFNFLFRGSVSNSSQPVYTLFSFFSLSLSTPSFLHLPLHVISLIP